MAPGFSLGRPQAVLVATLLALAALAWWEVEQRMDRMDAAAGAGLGGRGFHLGLWIVMMAAMMLPSITPVIVVYDRLRAGRRARGARARDREGSALFAGGYLVAWTMAGRTAAGR